MVLSYDELNDEACWRAQVVPPALEWLGAGLRAHFGVGRDLIGSPGDNRHLRGGHRSRRWIRESEHCTNRTYTVTYPADKQGDEDWYSAIDIDPDDRAELIAMTRRLDKAVRAGLFPEISEWFGNLGGDSVVDGWNNITDRPATSDSSHLGHTHITFLRKHANDRPLMERLLAVLIGEFMPSEADWRALTNRVDSLIDMDDINPVGDNLRPEPNELGRAIRRIESGTVKLVDLLAQAIESGGGHLDTAAVLQRIDERAAEDAARDAAAAARIAELEADLQAYRDAEAAAARAAADVLDGA